MTNPYNIYYPEINNTFKTREYILKQLNELWEVRKNPKSVILYGQTKIGKSSIAQSLADNYNEKYKVIYVNLSSIKYNKNSLSQILLLITKQIQKYYNCNAIIYRSNSCEEMMFKEYLNIVIDYIEPQNLIIALDKYEIINELIERNFLKSSIFNFLKTITENNKKIGFTLIGKNKPEDIKEIYYQSFLKILTPININYLTEKETKLILKKEQNINIKQLIYTEKALNNIYFLTYGQPYLTQLIGFQLYNTFCRKEKLELGNKTLIDTEKIIQIINKDLFLIGNIYFQTIYRQITEKDKRREAILRIIANNNNGISEKEIIRQTEIERQELQTINDKLTKNNVVQIVNNKYYITIELIKKWINNEYSLSYK